MQTALAIIGLLFIGLFTFLVLAILVIYFYSKKRLDMVKEAKTPEEREEVINNIKKGNPILRKALDKIDNPKHTGCCGGNKSE